MTRPIEFSTLRERFYKKVVPGADCCWVWTGWKTTGGYGKIRVKDGDDVHYAHRVSYELHVGPIPEGLTIDHLCRNRACVNPAHMEPVTQSENTRRGLTRTHCKRGHEFTPENTYSYVWRGKPRRYCQTCINIRSLARHA